MNHDSRACILGLIAWALLFAGLAYLARHDPPSLRFFLFVGSLGTVAIALQAICKDEIS